MARRRKPWRWRTKGKSSEGSTTLYLENYKLVPRHHFDLPSARDALSTSRSDIFFVEAQPFERTYSQSQQWRRGRREQPPQVAEHQKEIIAATWNQLKNPQRTPREQESARLLAGIQSKLRTRRSRLRSACGAASCTRLTRRSSNSPRYVASREAMGQATEKLRGREWQAALPPEQKSLQHLLRAEALFRDIQVAFGRGGGGAGRDLEGLFDLELDREKNQFETAAIPLRPIKSRRRSKKTLASWRTGATPAGTGRQQRQQQQALPAALAAGDARREAEELRKKMEQLARSQQSASQGRQGSRAGQPAKPGPAESRTGSRPAGSAGRLRAGAFIGRQNSALNRAIERLAEATRTLQNAGSPQNQGSAQSEAQARRAASGSVKRDSPRRRTQAAGRPANGRAGAKIPGTCRTAANFEGRMRQTFAGAGDDQGRPALMQPGIRASK